MRCDNGGGRGVSCLEVEVAYLALGETEFVPEPGTVLVLGSGLVGLAGYASLRRRSRDG